MMRLEVSMLCKVHSCPGADCNLGPTWEQKSRLRREKMFLFQGQLEMFLGRSVFGSTWDVPGPIYSLSSTPNCSLWLAVTD